MTELNKHDQYILAIYEAAFRGLNKCEEELNQYYLDEYREGSSISKLREKRARSANPATIALAEVDAIMEKAKDSVEKENNQ